MIKKDEILKGRHLKYKNEYTKEIDKNIDKLLEKINIVRRRYAKPMIVTSGWRPPQLNSKLSNAGKKSNHIKGLAVDIYDAGDLWPWCIKHIEWLAGLGFYFEDPRWTPTWVHFQIVPPKSHKRIFIPNSHPPKNPSRWDGKYNHELDY